MKHLINTLLAVVLFVLMGGALPSELPRTGLPLAAWGAIGAFLTFLGWAMVHAGHSGDGQE